MATEVDTEIALLSSQKLSSLIDPSTTKATIKVILNGNQDESITIPTIALSLLAEVLNQVGQGKSIEIVPTDKELSTTEAASILKVSRPYLINLLESNQIPYRKVGKHRRVLYQDVMAYKTQIDEARKKTLAELAAQAQELNLGYE